MTSALTRDVRPRVLLIYTGGTIGMSHDPQTGHLVPFGCDTLIANAPKVARLGIDLETVALEPAIDSANMDPAVWQALAATIGARYGAFDGFVVLHGTDTMAYTASALSFMLGGLKKPVILTGSQVPIGEIREDGTENLISALQIAAARDQASGAPVVQEVAIAFGRHLLRGNRTTKVSSCDFGAFKSYNYPPLGTMDLHLEFHERLLWRTPEVGPLELYNTLDTHVGVLVVHPAISPESVAAVLGQPNLKAVIIRTYGAGNAPTAAWFIEALAEANRRGVVLVNITQCAAGGVEDALYECGAELRRAGVISGRDMTFEAALTKLMHLFGRGLDGPAVKAYLPHSMRGELTQKHV